MWSCFPKIQTKKERKKKKFSEVCCHQMCFCFCCINSHVTGICISLFFYQLAGSRLSIFASSPHLNCLRAESGDVLARTALRIKSSRLRQRGEVPVRRSRRLHSDLAGLTLAPDLCVTFVHKITPLLFRRGVGDARES